VWEILMSSIRTLTQLTCLDLRGMDLHHASSATYFPALARALESLPMLAVLCLGGRSISQAVTDTAAFAAGRALVRTIGALPQLGMLLLCRLGALDVLDCCHYIAPLTRLWGLQLVSLPAVRTAVDGNAQAPFLAGDTFTHLLTRLTRLQSLQLSDINVRGSAAVRVFETIVPTLPHLQDLRLENNGLGVAPLTLLAHSTRQLPRLRRIQLGLGNDLVGAGPGGPRHAGRSE
jgi:hypothetical protein